MSSASSSSSTPQFLSQLAERTGLSPADAGRLASVTLAGLGRQLQPGVAARLGDELPPVLGEWLSRGPHAVDRGLPALHAHLAAVAPGAEAFTAEHAVVACQVLAESLGRTALEALRAALSADVAALLEARAAPSPRG